MYPLISAESLACFAQCPALLSLFSISESLFSEISLSSLVRIILKGLFSSWLPTRNSYSLVSPIFNSFPNSPAFVTKYFVFFNYSPVYISNIFQKCLGHAVTCSICIWSVQISKIYHFIFTYQYIYQHKIST